MKTLKTYIEDILLMESLTLGNLDTVKLTKLINKNYDVTGLDITDERDSEGRLIVNAESVSAKKNMLWLKILVLHNLEIFQQKFIMLIFCVMYHKINILIWKPLKII